MYNRASVPDFVSLKQNRFKQLAQLVLEKISFKERLTYDEVDQRVTEVPRCKVFSLPIYFCRAIICSRCLYDFLNVNVGTLPQLALCLREDHVLV